MLSGRADHSVCCVKGRYLLVSGAVKYNHADSVELYDLMVDKSDKSSEAWQGMPSLKQGRYFHTSCSSGDLVFVFCGKARPSAKPIASIERLSMKNLAAGWQTLHHPTAQDMQARMGSGLCELPSGGQILIIGGWAATGLSDIYILDAEQGSLEQIGHRNT